MRKSRGGELWGERRGEARRGKERKGKERRGRGKKRQRNPEKDRCREGDITGC